MPIMKLRLYQRFRKISQMLEFHFFSKLLTVKSNYYHNHPHLSLSADKAGPVDVYKRKKSITRNCTNKKRR